MKRWVVHGSVTVSCYVLVEAEDAATAMRIASCAEGTLCPDGPERQGITPIESFIVEGADGSMEPDRAETLDESSDLWHWFVERDEELDDVEDPDRDDP